MKTLLLLRHAKSSWSSPALTDHQRPLNNRGKRDAPRMGQLIKEQNLTPDVIVTSTAKRARKTAEKVAAACDYQGEIHQSEDLYESSSRIYVEVLRQIPDDLQRVMLVAHNPTLAELISVLTGRDEDVPTCALAQIELPIETWSDLQIAKVGRLIHLWRPREV